MCFFSISSLHQILVLVTSTSEMSQFLVFFYKSFVKILTHCDATNTVTVLTLPTVKLSLIRNLQLFRTNILRHVTLTMPTVWAWTICPWIHFHDVVTLMKTVLNAKFTVKCVLRCLLVLATSETHVIIVTVWSCLQASAKTCHCFYRTCLHQVFGWTEIT